MGADSAWPAAVTRALAASPAPEIQVGTPFYVSQAVAKAIKSLSEAVGGWGMVIAPATEAQVAQVPMLRAGSRSGLHYVYILLSNIDNEVVLRAAQAQDVVRRVPGLLEAEGKRLKSLEAVRREAQSAAPRVRAASVVTSFFLS